MESKKKVSTSQAIIMLVVAMAVVLLGVLVVGAPTTITLFVAGTVIIIMSVLFGVKWADMQIDIVENIKSMMVPILILLAVGMLIGSWMLGGTVPYMVALGLKILSPRFFLFLTCLICSVMSITAGTSWGTIGTVGVALMGVSAGLGIPLEYTAGAIVVGAIFGDKLSPLSDTTVLAAAVADVEITSHMKQMLYTTFPGWIVSLILYLVLGSKYTSGSASGGNVDVIINTLESTFSLNPIMLIPPVLVLTLIILKKPTLPVFAFGIMAGVILAIVFQGATLTEVANALNSGYTEATGIDIVDGMLLRGGIKSMLGTVALLIAASVLGAPLKTAGVVDVLLNAITHVCRNWKSILTGTFFIHGLMFMITGSYYVTFSVLGPMFKPLYDDYDLDGTNLSRTLEVTGTGLAAIVPWSVTGAFIASTLEVTTGQFFLYCPMIWLALLLSIFYFATGIGVKRISKDKVEIAN